MRVVVVTPPTPVVSYAEAVVRLRLAGGADEQGDVEMMIAAATALIDGPGGWLGRAIGEQILEARLDAFCASIDLPYPPIATIVSVKYIDAAGIEQTVPSNDYVLAGRKLTPLPGKAWPSPRNQPEAVRIRYDAGYEVVPANIKSAILLMTGDQYRHRDSAPELSIAAERLLEPLRVWA
ncbi:phage gp6-like head-tail connector protein [Rhizorhabdus wittichii]|uniref:Phage gp6-like head-tail connector protein n=1 Tax=Rhizorhabdus wittichii TaxID=160791 RepID=A0A975D365_9SPHN|nr:head-tail connector protein [Rhizorhabdus wittichii]QTH21993.1 phage gp6-like head-tail connector protein [Rhizorhabdus wittichii]